MPAAHERPRVLLVGSGHQGYCEYLLEWLAEAARVWLLSGTPPTWEARYLEGHTHVAHFDTPSTLPILWARRLHHARPFDGVVTWDEGHTIRTAHIAQALGLPGGDPYAVRRCRDKHHTRTALAQQGVPSARSQLVNTAAEARDAAAALGYPVVVKPRSLSASQGVCLVTAPERLESAFRNARRAEDRLSTALDEGVLVEEYLDGPEISCDSVLLAGRLSPYVVARKWLGFPPYFEEIGHLVDGQDPLQRDPQLGDVLERAHRAVGLIHGITHTELRLTAQGPKIVEINCRLGGDLIPYVGHCATRFDPGRTAVDVACGRAPAPASSVARVAAVHFFYPSRALTVAGVDIDRQALPAEVVRVEALVRPGRELALPPEGHVSGRYALAVVAADTAAGCRAALESCARAVVLRANDGSHEPARVREPL